MAVIAKVKKLVGGNVQLLDISDNVLIELPAKVQLQLLIRYSLNFVVYLGRTHTIDAANITELIIDPAPAVPFAGSNTDLFRELAEDFFEDVLAITSDAVLNLSNVTGQTVTDALNTLFAGVPATDPDAIHDNVANEISAITEKDPVSDDDLVIIEDSAAGFVKKKVKVKNLPATFTGPIIFDSEINPPAIVGNQNDYNPAGLSTAIVVNLQSTGNISITGIQAPAPARNQIIYVLNVGANNIQFLDNNAGSAAGNRILMGGNRTIQPDESIQFVYSVTFSRWRGVARNT